MKTPKTLKPESGSSLLTKLLNKGDEISITHGQLLIKPSSGLAVPPDWLKQHEPMLIKYICQLFDITALRYVSYTTGSYGVNKSQGITLQFNNLQTNDDAYIIYNASLKRVRNGKRSKKGEPLPDKQFIVSERSSFYKFWCSTGLPLPRSISKFYECMGKLKPLIFTSQVDFKNRIINKKLPLLEVAYSEILEKESKYPGSKINANITAKKPLIFRQETAKKPLKLIAKDIELDHIHYGLAPNQSTCASKYGNKVIRKELISKGISSDITLNSKEIDGNDNRAKTAKKTPQEQTVDEWLDEWENAPSLPNGLGIDEEVLNAEVEQLILATKCRKINVA